MARSYVKGILKFKSLDANKKAENVSMPNLVENASAEDIKSVRDAIGSLVEHPITETQVTEVFSVN